MAARFHALRKPQPAVALDRSVFAWWMTLPLHQCPHRLAKFYPRILNQIVACWDAPRPCDRYLGELIFDTTRFDRQGFSMAVATELLVLRGVLQARLREAGDDAVRLAGDCTHSCP